MTKKLTWPSRLILAIAAGAAISLVPSAPAIGDGHHHHCPPGSTTEEYCQVACVPPYVVGEHLGDAIRQINDADCSVGRITCIKASGGWRRGHGSTDCGLWRWGGGRHWAQYRHRGSWRSAHSASRAHDLWGGCGPWNLGATVIAQSPAAGGQYPIGTPINLVIQVYGGH